MESLTWGCPSFASAQDTSWIAAAGALVKTERSPFWIALLINKYFLSYSFDKTAMRDEATEIISLLLSFAVCSVGLLSTHNWLYYY